VNRNEFPRPKTRSNTLGLALGSIAFVGGSAAVTAAAYAGENQPSGYVALQPANPDLSRPIISSSIDTEGKVITQIQPQVAVINAPQLNIPNSQPEAIQGVQVPKAPVLENQQTVFTSPAIKPPENTAPPPSAPAVPVFRQVEPSLPPKAAVVVQTPKAITPDQRKAPPPPPSLQPYAKAQPVQEAKPIVESYLLPTPPLDGYRQKYTLSCEVASTKIALSYWQDRLQGVDLSEEKLQEVLGINDDPNLGFRGDYKSNPKGLQNYGANAPAIKRLVENYPKQGLFKTEILSNIEQVKAALKQNKPVLLWVTFGLNPSHDQSTNVGNLVPNEHVVVATGFVGDKIRISDPEYSNNVSGMVSESLLAQRMSLFSQPALAISPT